MAEKDKKEMKHGVDAAVQSAIERLTTDETPKAAQPPAPLLQEDGSLNTGEEAPKVKRVRRVHKNEAEQTGASPAPESLADSPPLGLEVEEAAKAHRPGRKPRKAAPKPEEDSAAVAAPKAEAPAAAKPAPEAPARKAPRAEKAPAADAPKPKKKRVVVTIPHPELEQQPAQIFGSNMLASETQKQSVVVERRKEHHADHKLRVIPLGGLGEVGKNMTLFEYNDDIVVVDGGVSFPGDGMFGIDLVLPDFSYLIENKHKVRAFLLTHGHEDHIGAMPYILKDVQAPVYGSALTLGLLKGKLSEQQIEAELHPVAPREEVDAGPFKVEFFRLTHSIPDSMGLAIHTPLGTVLFVSDFKMDMSPIDGQLMDFGRISALGEKGVLLLCSDSTNVERPGFTDSERSVGYNLERFFVSAKGRIIVTSFASHVHRAQQVLWAAERSGRKVAVVGRGMQNMFAIAGEMGYLDIQPNLLIDISRINDYPPDKVAVITTGSQGEPLSGLTRMASGEHRQVHILPGDTVIISANPIPGNELTVGKTVDNLFRLGANVIHDRNQGVHVSGHASQEELKVLLNMVKPRFFMPVHGDYRMLYKHALLAQQLGMAPENTAIMENGQVLEVSRKGCQINGTVPSGRVLIDGLGVGDVGSTVLKERRQLSESGVIVLSMIYTKRKNARILAGPEIYSRGFIFEKEYEHIISEMKERVIAMCTPENLTDGNIHDLRSQLRSGLARFVLERTGRRPVIMAVIVEV